MLARADTPVVVIVLCQKHMRRQGEEKRGSKLKEGRKGREGRRGEGEGRERREAGWMEAVKGWIDG